MALVFTTSGPGRYQNHNALEFTVPVSHTNTPKYHYSPRCQKLPCLSYTAACMLPRLWLLVLVSWSSLTGSVVSCCPRCCTVIMRRCFRDLFRDRLPWRPQLVVRWSHYVSVGARPFSSSRQRLPRSSLCWQVPEERLLRIPLFLSPPVHGYRRLPFLPPCGATFGARSDCQPSSLQHAPGRIAAACRPAWPRLLKRAGATSPAVALDTLTCIP